MNTSSSSEKTSVEYPKDLYLKENLEKYQQVRSMIVGAENWFLCSGNLCSITSTVGIDNRSIEMILDDMEKAGKIVRIKEFSIVYPTWDYAHENPERVYTGALKWYTKQYAIENKLLDIKCRACSKMFHSDEDMIKHFNRVHTPARH